MPDTEPLKIVAVLVASTDPVASRTISTVLGISNEYYVRNVNSESAALAILNGIRFDLLIVDIDPHGPNGLDGFELIKQVVGRQLLVDKQVVVLTSLPVSDATVRWLTDRRFKILPKPLKRSQVLGAIRDSVNEIRKSGAA